MYDPPISLFYSLRSVASTDDLIVQLFTLTQTTGKSAITLTLGKYFPKVGKVRKFNHKSGDRLRQVQTATVIGSGVKVAAGSSHRLMPQSLLN